jgi:lysine biosynthesis protein LysW
MPSAHCPECDAVISVNNPREGDEITCRGCGTDLEVVSARPLEVDYPYDGDWDDDYDYDDV